MKRIAILILLIAVVLSGCGIIPKAITPSTDQAPTPVVSSETAAPADTAVPTDVPVPTVAPTDVPAPTKTASPAATTLAFVGTDGNITLKDLKTGSDQKITADATPTLMSADQSVVYLDLTWSSDGQFLAYQRLLATPIESGQKYTFSLWVYDTQTNSAHEVLADTQTAGFAWRPGTHQLTYAKTVQEGYFVTRAQLDATKASGIWAVDVTPGSAPEEIVPPTGGFSLVSPQWSADGRIVAFAEVIGMEGTGNFAYFNMDTAEYVRREQPVGGYDLTPDGSRLVYDTLTYTPGGTERIWVMKLDWTGGQRISPDYADGYAFGPRLSPDGQQVAYFKGLASPGESAQDRSELFVQPVAQTNDPRSLGVVVLPVSWDWLADGKSLLLSRGDPEHREIITIRLEDAHIEKLADGNFPAMRP